MPFYRVHDLFLESDLPLLPLAPLESAREPDDEKPVCITAGQFADELERPEISRRFYQISGDTALLRTRGVGRLLVTDGNRITYDLASACRSTDLASHILGSGTSIIHQQRGNVVLHGASLCWHGKAFLLSGASGAGKSTLAAHMLQRGMTTLGDDVHAIGESPDFLVRPGPPSTKLASDALAKLPGLAALPRLGTCSSGKTIFSTVDLHERNALPLAGIAIVSVCSDPVPTTERLSGAHAVAALRENTFRKRCITDGSAQKLFAKWSRIAAAVPIWRITRPSGRDTRREIVEILEGIMNRSSELDVRRTSVALG